MPKLARTLAPAAMLAVMSLAPVTAVAETHAADHATSQDAEHPATVRRVTSAQQAAADTAHRRLLAQERSLTPRGARPAAQSDAAGRARPPARLADPGAGRVGFPGTDRRSGRAGRPARQPPPRRRADGLTTAWSSAGGDQRPVAVSVRLVQPAASITASMARMSS